MTTTYPHNFLKNVICRLDFPMILRLEKERPATFQERIKEKFPKINEAVVHSAQIQTSDSPTIRLDDAILQWEFFTRNEEKKLTLQKNFLLLEDREFQDFGEFKEYFKMGFDALNTLYTPSVFIRLGLRYQNLLEPKLNKPNPFEWKGFVQDHLICYLNQHRSNLLRDTHSLTLRTDNGHVILQWGIHNPDFPAPVTKSMFYLDIDCYLRDDIDQSGVMDVLGRLNVNAVDIFEQSIGDLWRQEMQKGG